jgi:GMP synthase-like glutamine amidotransferase
VSNERHREHFGVDRCRPPLVGVLALQGDFADHQDALHRQGVRTRQVRTAADLRGLHGLVLPGGESTTMLKLLDVEGLWHPLGEALRSGLPVFATCAGMILLAERVENPSQRSYGLLPITVVRNGYGRQYHSGTFALTSDVLPGHDRHVHPGAAHHRGRGGHARCSRAAATTPCWCRRGRSSRLASIRSSPRASTRW